MKVQPSFIASFGFNFNTASNPVGHWFRTWNACRFANFVTWVDIIYIRYYYQTNINKFCEMNYLGTWIGTFEGCFWKPFSAALALNWSSALLWWYIRIFPFDSEVFVTRDKTDGSLFTFKSAFRATCWVFVHSNRALIECIRIRKEFFWRDTWISISCCGSCSSTCCRCYWYWACTCCCAGSCCTGSRCCGSCCWSITRNSYISTIDKFFLSTVTHTTVSISIATPIISTMINPL